MVIASLRQWMDSANSLSEEIFSNFFPSDRILPKTTRRPKISRRLFLPPSSHVAAQRQAKPNGAFWRGCEWVTSPHRPIWGKGTNEEGRKNSRVQRLQWASTQLPHELLRKVCNGSRPMSGARERFHHPLRRVSSFPFDRRGRSRRKGRSQYPVGPR